MSIEAMKQMVHELEYVLICINIDKMPFDGDDFHEALRLGRQAIAEAEKQKALQKLHDENERLGLYQGVYEQEPVRLQCTTCGTVYADGVPPQRQWVGLTEDEVEMLVENKRAAHCEFVRQVEAKLKEKNT